MRPFTDQEYASRLRRTRTAMADRGIDLLVVSDPANMNYLTGFDAWSFYVPQVVLVPAEDEPPVWIGRAMDASTAAATTDLPAGNVIGYDEGYVDAPDRHAFEAVATTIRERGWAGGAIGLEQDAYYLSPRARDVLAGALPGARLADAYLLVNRVRLVKSAAEIEVMRDAARIVEGAMEAAVAAARPGVRECDAVAEMVKAQLVATPQFGGDYPAAWPHIGTGERSGMPHAPWSDRVLREGEAMNVELGGTRHRYHAGLARTLYLGTPPDALRRLADVVAEGQDAALAAVRPGATGEDVERAWRAAISRHGLEKPSRIAYPIGIGYPPVWGEHTVSFRPGDTTPLEPNMTFHMILGMWLEGGGYETSETIRVTPDGVECLTSFRRGILTAA